MDAFWSGTGLCLVPRFIVLIKGIGFISFSCWNWQSVILVTLTTESIVTCYGSVVNCERHELYALFEVLTLWSNRMFLPSTCRLKPWILLWDRIYSSLKLMGAQCVPSYLGTILFGLLFGNYGIYPYSTIDLKLLFKILNVFWFNHDVDCIKGTLVFEMFESRIEW